MTQHEHAKILAFVGMSGAGKTEAVDYVVAKGYPKVYFGGIVVNGVKERGLEVNEANERSYREEMRLLEGKDFIVKRINQQIKDLIASGQHRIVADGLYTWTEYKAMKHEFPGELTVVAVMTPRHLRHRRLSNRPVRPLTEDEATKRDWSEIENLEKGGPIAIADHYIINDGSIEKLHEQIDTILQDIGFLS